VREFASALLPFSQGAYINQVGTEAEEGEEAIQAAFGENFQRLAALKRKYDPANLFSHNQNIRPRV
jgi:FAD/FMN-containing dehydrogenase